MKQIGNLAKLKELLFQLERDIGIEELSQNEKDILYAFHLIVGQDSGDKIVKVDDVRSHPTVVGIKHATYHRALKRLLERGLIEHAPDRKNGAYRLVPQS